jgi:hypothetical protein
MKVYLLESKILDQLKELVAHATGQGETIDFIELENHEAAELVRLLYSTATEKEKDYIYTRGWLVLRLKYSGTEHVTLKWLPPTRGEVLT